MTAMRRTRVVLEAAPIASVWTDEPPSPTGPAFRYVEEWVPTPRVAEWTEWRVVERKRDDAPSYSHHGESVGLFAWRTTSSTPYFQWTYTEERRLIERWTDQEHGPMAETVDIQTRTHRV